jgi:hypothetical protein
VNYELPPELTVNREARVVILTGAGRTFCGFAAEEVTIQTVEHRQRLLAMLLKPQ